MPFILFLGHVLGAALLLLAAIGTGYTVAAALVLGRFFDRAPPAPAPIEPVTLLKPLHGDEPQLRANLGTFLHQANAGAVEMLCGIQLADDPAGQAVEQLAGGDPGTEVTLIVDPTRHGTNAKVSNLVNLAQRARHSVLVLSDSDMVVGADYLAHILGALARPRTGAVTCLYRGRGDAGWWSRLGAAGLSYQFLPGAAFGVATGLARPCMGSTIAFRRETLDRIGGFARFADMLADDYAIGEAVRGTGLTVAVPPLLLVHASAERSFAELWRHELRWSATIRALHPAAWAGSVVTMPLPLALIGTVLAGGSRTAWGIALFALAARLLVVGRVDQVSGGRTASPLLLPLRDALSFAVFIATLFVRSVDWRGSRLRMEADGRIVPEAESVAR